MKITLATIALLVICSSCGLFEPEPELFKRPDFEIKNIETDLYGKWYLIEITDLKSDKTQYPPVGRNPEVIFYKDSKEVDWWFEGFIYEFPFEAKVVNTFMSSFNETNDSVSISEGMRTLLFSEKSHLMQFENLFFTTLSGRGFNIKIEKNILKLSDGSSELMFYK